MNAHTAPFLTLEEIQTRWPGGQLVNDLIESFSIDVTGHGGNVVSPVFHLAVAQSFGWGYVSTANIGHIIRRVAELLDLFGDESRDFGREIARCPIRLYSWGHAGQKFMDTICIGHFLKDRFVYGADLMRSGLPLEVEELAKALGCTPKYLAGVLQGRRHGASPILVEKLARMGITTTVTGEAL